MGVLRDGKVFRKAKKFFQIETTSNRKVVIDSLTLVFVRVWKKI